MARFVFGDEAAEWDDLLPECYIPGTSADKSILVGRWGTGKSAILLSHARQLCELLDEPTTPPPFWYIREEAFDVRGLLALRQEHEGDRQLFITALEEVWKAELLRTACAVLNRLRDPIDGCDGKHWDVVTAIAKKGALRRSLWKQLPDIIALIFGRQRGESLRGVQREVENVFLDTTFPNVQQCLTDLAAKDIRPVICIEPIETPTGALEEKVGLAQGIVTSLLNVFQSTFRPHSTQLLDVRVAIPWHRYDRDTLNFPQKLEEFRGDIYWDEEALKDFINRRITWEFKRVGRKVSSGSDAWKQLFEPRVRNDHCEGAIQEDSFAYVLRHTHYRARDIQKFARLCVEGYAAEKEIQRDDVLRGRNGLKVSQSCIRKVVREESQNMATLLRTEGWRRYSALPRILDELQGMAVPFSLKQLDQRLADMADVDVNIALSILWRCGVVGVFIRPKDQKHVKQLQDDFGLDGFRQYQIAGGQKVQGWSLFAYSWTGRPGELLTRYADSDAGGAKLILHPQLFEYLAAHPERGMPMGA